MEADGQTHLFRHRVLHKGRLTLIYGHHIHAFLLISDVTMQ